MLEPLQSQITQLAMLIIIPPKLGNLKPFLYFSVCDERGEIEVNEITEKPLHRDMLKTKVNVGLHKV